MPDVYLSLVYQGVFLKMYMFEVDLGLVYQGVFLKMYMPEADLGLVYLRKRLYSWKCICLRCIWVGAQCLQDSPRAGTNLELSSLVTVVTLQ